MRVSSWVPDWRVRLRRGRGNIQKGKVVVISLREVEGAVLSEAGYKAKANSH